MKTYTCKYISASEIFNLGQKNSLDLAWETFCESQEFCLWGHNNHSMVTPDTIIDILENCFPEGKQEKQVNKAITILQSIKPDVYVDLEN